MSQYIFKDYNIYEMDCKSLDQKWILEINEKKFVINKDVRNFILKYSNVYFDDLKLTDLENQIFVLLKDKGCFGKNSNKTNNKDFLKLVFKKRLFGQKTLRHLKIFECLISKFAAVLITPLIATNIIYSCFFNDIDYNNRNLFIVFFLIIISAVFHEIGHISASIKFGITPKWAGVGIYFISPIFFVDVDDTWRLPQKQRLVVDIAGIYFQLIIAAIYLICFFSFNQILFLQASHLIIISALFNLNPFLKYDGYWILSDILGVYNLSQYLAVSVKTLFYNLFGKNKIKHLRYKKNQVYIIAAYALVSMIFYIVFSISLIKKCCLGLKNIFYQFQWQGLCLNLMFLFFAIFSIISLYGMIKNIISAKISNF